MSKKRKTRQQKVIAQLRRTIQLQDQQKSYDLPSDTTSYKTRQVPQTSLPLETYKLVQSTQKDQATISHTFVISDLKKTMWLVASIAAAESVLFFLLKNKILSLSMVNL